ncbi:integral membrane protein [Lasiosphaeria ovina]|uniref:Integral membrane protein n=1 Tax=Lasiosphaeria ovina TaxID=92902 RepID=A0AAE0KIP3_9PEZI|nr:integral membrane protein [Lasiosphaeria ovina]
MAEAASKRAATQLPGDFLNETRGGALVGISIGFAVITSVVVPLRFYARTLRPASFGLDDFLILAAYIFNLALCALGITMVQIGGVGQHVEALELRNPSALVGWAKVLLAFEFVYFTAVALPKMSILCLYLRVFKWAHGPMRTASLALFGFVAATWLSMMVTVCFQCRPIAFWWDRSIPGGRCIDVQAFYHAQSIPGVVLDLFIMALPLRTIWGLSMPTAKRLALVLVFLVASLGVVASVVRATMLFSNSAFDDRTWASVLLCGWSVVESSCYITANCLSSMRPLVSHFAPQWLKDGFQKAVESVSRHTLIISASASGSRPRKAATRPDDDTIELTPDPNIKGKINETPFNRFGEEYRGHSGL